MKKFIIPMVCTLICSVIVICSEGNIDKKGLVVLISILVILFSIAPGVIYYKKFQTKDKQNIENFLRFKDYDFELGEIREEFMKPGKINF